MKFSIIIAAYNAELEIEKTIQSILDQSFKDYEIIVINDSSTDNTKSVVSKLNKVILIDNEKNIKAGGSRNRGLDIAKGEYIVFLDSDDCLADETVLERLNNNISDNHTPDVVYIGFKTSDTGKEYLPNSYNSEKLVRLREWKYANIWDVCWNREFLNKNNMRFVEEKYFEDFPFYYEGVLKSKTYSFIEYPIITYTKNRKASMTTALNTRKICDFYNNMTLLVNLYDIVSGEERKILSEIIIREHHNLENYFLKMI